MYVCFLFTLGCTVYRHSRSPKYTSSFIETERNNSIILHIIIVSQLLLRISIIIILIYLVQRNNVSNFKGWMYAYFTIRILWDKIRYTTRTRRSSTRVEIVIVFSSRTTINVEVPCFVKTYTYAWNCASMVSCCIYIIW